MKVNFSRRSTPASLVIAVILVQDSNLQLTLSEVLRSIRESLQKQIKILLGHLTRYFKKLLTSKMLGLRQILLSDT